MASLDTLELGKLILPYKYIVNCPQVNTFCKYSMLFLVCKVPLKGEEKTKPAARRQTHTQGRFLVILKVPCGLQSVCKQTCKHLVRSTLYILLYLFFFFIYTKYITLFTLDTHKLHKTHYSHRPNT